VKAAEALFALCPRGGGVEKEELERNQVKMVSLRCLVFSLEMRPGWGRGCVLGEQRGLASPVLWGRRGPFPD